MKQSDKRGLIGRTREFIAQVRQEISKVTWPSRKETGMTTVFVFIFAMVAAIYFLLVDQVIFRFVHYIISFGS